MAHEAEIALLELARKLISDVASTLREKDRDGALVDTGKVAVFGGFRSWNYDACRASDEVERLRFLLENKPLESYDAECVEKGECKYRHCTGKGLCPSFASKGKEE